MSELNSAAARFGVVAIGRNEGERLRKCLESVCQLAAAVVYVDSGSTDSSVPMAQALGVTVVGLDMNRPFTAARARNEGFERLKQIAPDLDYVQFVDGDCEVVAGWTEAALAFLDQNPEVASVCGWRAERYPERTLYNLLCDIEWHGPAGQIKACGGDAMFRCKALEAANGYRPDLIAGEEPELCVRLRASGWKIWRLPLKMTLHDADMTRFDQWWKRSKRCGYAFAQGAQIHGAPPERHRVVESRRGWIWAVLLPLGIVLTATVSSWLALSLLALYPVQIIRMARQGQRSFRENLIWSAFIMLGKFAEVSGQIKFLKDHFRGSQSRLIEYK